MVKVIVTGTPGSGKTTVLAKIKSVKIINLAEEMLKLSAGKGHNHDTLRYMSFSEIAEMRKEVILNINKVSEDSIVDTHLTVKRGTRYVPGFSTADLSLFKEIRGLIYVDAHANDIMFRRLTDKSRKREEEPEEEIHEQRRINISMAGFYSSYLNMPLYIIKNRQNMLDAAVKDMESALDEVFGKQKKN